MWAEEIKIRVHCLRFLAKILHSEAKNARNDERRKRKLAEMAAAEEHAAWLEQHIT